MPAGEKVPVPSQELVEVCLGSPEQFFAVECLLQSAANATHVAERAEMWDVTPEVAESLAAAAKVSQEAAVALLTSLCPSAEAFQVVFAELTEKVAV